MDTKKSQGPSRAVLAVSAVVLCALLIGAALFLRDENKAPKPAASSPAASTIQPLFDRCTGEPSNEVVDGLDRTTCTSQDHPAFMVYLDSHDGTVVRAGLMVPMYGREEDRIERNEVGLELFRLMAGAPAETFMAPDLLAQIGVTETRVERGGLVYQTRPMANVGLVFAVFPVSSGAALEN
jgi:hypothetical protein